jgi:hypothetical protein
VKTWTVRSNQPGGNDYLISGDDLPGAIVRNFTRIAKDASIGNAAGYRLVAVQLDADNPQVTSGGRPFATLTIVHRGADLAHRPASPQPETAIVRIVCERGEVPEGGVAIAIG